MSGRVVPITDLPIFFLVSDIIEMAILEVGEQVVFLKGVVAKKAVVVEEIRSDAMATALIVNMFG